MFRHPIVAAASALLAVGFWLPSTAALADPPTLTGSNYNPPCNDITVPYMSCVQGGGGQVVIMTGTGLSACTALIAMGGGWSGSLPVTVNGAGTEIQFTVPNDATFFGWALFNCGFQPSSFLFQSPTYPPLAVDVTLTVDALADATVGDPVPTPTYTTNPSTTAADWTTLPTCGVFDPADLTTALTQLTTAGTFVTRCADGVKADGGDVTYVDGSLVVNAAPPGPEGESGDGSDGSGATGSLPNSGISAVAATTLALGAGIAIVLALALRRGQLRLVTVSQDVRLGAALRRLHAKLRRMERHR